MEIKYNNVDFFYNYDEDDQKKVLDNINLIFKTGLINGVIGPSGSGKSTLVQMINALLIPYSGEVLVDDFIIKKGNKINLKNLRFDVGFMFQFPEEQFFQSTVKAEIAFGLHYFKYKEDKIDKRISDALKMVELSDDYLDRNPHTLSNGEKRKVALATILAINPKVIVLDEPTIGLDENGKKMFIKILKIVKRRYHKTIIVVTHDIELLHKYVDYIYVIKNGKFVLDGNKYDVFKESLKLKKMGILVPKIIEFENMVKVKKNIKLGYRDDINDLIKDIYRNV